MNPAKKAFTLIELLVVIAIIGILTTIAVVSLNNARAKARDAKRVADVKQVQTALELFFNDKGRYPTPTEFAVGSVYSTSTNGTTTYMGIIPSAPNPPDGSCDSTTNSYDYGLDPTNNNYGLDLCLGGNVASVNASEVCATPNGFISGNCCETIFRPAIAGELYPTVKIGNQCWLAKNLDLGTQVNGGVAQADAQTGSFEKYCFDNDVNNCTSEGALYQWHTILGFPTACDNYVIFADNGDGTYTGTCGGTPYTIQATHQGICPVGWHVPSDADWHVLELDLANPSNEIDCSGSRDGGSWGCAPAGAALSPSGTSGFNLTYPGQYSQLNGGFIYHYLVEFWSTMPNNNDNGMHAYRHMIGRLDMYPAAKVSRDYYMRISGYSIRCLKDQ